MTVTAENDRIRVTVVGDIMLDVRLRAPRIFYEYPGVAACIPGFAFQWRVPYTNSPSTRAWFVEQERPLAAVDASAHVSDCRRLGDDDYAGDIHHPFRLIRKELRSADLVFGNIECPLSSRGRRTANDNCYRASPEYAEALAAASFSVVSFANNHCLDYGETAFAESLEALSRNGIGIVGAGPTLEEARRPFITNVRGARIAVLGYSMIGADNVYATDDECGVVPLNQFMAYEDIQRVRPHADVIIVSAHWGLELQAAPPPWVRAMAHQLIDFGADVLVGHHAHIPGAVEVYRGHPILYSMGNFIFGHDHTSWGDDMIASLELYEGRVDSIRFAPIRGRFQPRRLEGEPVLQLHRRLQEISAPFGTELTIAAGGADVALQL